MTPPDDPSGISSAPTEPEPPASSERGELRPGNAAYQIGDLLGRGGMGEVLLARDRRIGRRVALKRMREATPSDDSVGRFLREARVQALLEHPAIVPVYDIGEDDRGRPYFTMKRLAGVTLAATLATGAPLQRLLRAFVESCLAVEYAHSRGIVHRDLKPSNIMLGEFGEVYVLDWGIARVLDGDVEARTSGVIDTLEGTMTGAMLGTPGYMAPEQARGQDVRAAADVYALGCIVFEILAGEPLHPHGSDALTHTLTTPTASPASRAPARAIAPELDAACVAALGEDPAARPSARALAEQVQRYLDGDRDLGSRRSLAATFLAQAHTALATGDRASAMRLAGRSLALDPESAEAAALVSRLMIEPPAELPTDLAAHLSDGDAELARIQWRLSARGFLVYVALLPFLLWQGVTSWTTVAFIYATVVALIGVTSYNERQHRPSPTAALVLNYVLIALMTRVLGPFVLIPAVVCMQAQAWAAYPSMVDYAWRPVALMIGALVLPIVLEAYDVLSPTWSVAGGSLISSSAMLNLGGTATSVFLLVATIVTIATTAVIGHALAASRRRAQRRVEIQAWHLRQLVAR